MLTVAPTADLLDPAAFAVAPGAEPEIPEGFRRLPAGPVRVLRANREFVVHGLGKPWFVFEGERRFRCREVRVEGPAATRCEEVGGTGTGVRTLYVETAAALLVRD